MESKNAFKLSIGVDFGSTSTAVAYVLVDRKKVHEIRFIDGWPPSESGREVPSLISYIPDRLTPFWGHEVRPGMQIYAWTKLRLDRNTDQNAFRFKILEAFATSGFLQLPDGREAVDVVTDFLRPIYEHLRCLKLSAAPFGFWFTVPATWTEETRSLMDQAVRNAGFGSRPLDHVFFIPEPEAAALTVFHKMDVDLKPGDGVLVCDCGGGTVDIATYYVADVTPRLHFEQLTATTGMGYNHYARRKILMAGKPQKVILVGAFSSSPYLQATLKGSLQQMGIAVAVPPNPKEVVAYGAALHGSLAHMPPTYRCWRHYGLASAQPIRLIHKNEPQALGNGSRSTPPVDWVLCWVLSKDQRYPRDFQTTLTIHLPHWQHDQLVKPVSIYECDLATAPPQLDDPSVRCTDYIQCHFSGLDLTKFPHQSINGQMAYRLEILVQISFAPADRKIHFVVWALGIQIGQKELEMTLG